MSEPVLLPHPVVGGAFTSPVAPGIGWPDDPATADTPVARDADDVRRLAPDVPLAELDAWLEPYRAHLAERLDALERHLERTSTPITPKAKESR